MKDKRRPPPGITPAEFFEEWLPSEVERLGSAAGLPEMVVRVALQGAGGGVWDLDTFKGRLMVVPGGGERRPLVKLQMLVDDWRSMAVGDGGPVDLAPPTASATDVLFVDAASRRLLAGVDGTFRFEVRGYNGRTWAITASFGPAAAAEGREPEALIHTDAQTYSMMRARKLSPAEAYFGGKIGVEGDAAKGIQVAMALLSKLA